MGIRGDAHGVLAADLDCLTEAVWRTLKDNVATGEATWLESDRGC